MKIPRDSSSSQARLTTVGTLFRISGGEEGNLGSRVESGLPGFDSFPSVPWAGHFPLNLFPHLEKEWGT